MALTFSKKKATPPAEPEVQEEAKVETKPKVVKKGPVVKKPDPASKGTVSKAVGKATLSKAVGNEPAEEETTQVPVKTDNGVTSETDMASATVLGAAAVTVDVKMGFTKNLGEYQSARFDVGISIPCEPGDIDSTFTFASEWVNGNLEALLADE